MPRKPHQYRLLFRFHYEVKIEIVKPHLVFYKDKWHIYRSKWKSRFRSGNWMAACLSGSTISDIQDRIRRASDGYKYGYHQLPRS